MPASYRFTLKGNLSLNYQTLGCEVSLEDTPFPDESSEEFFSRVQNIVTDKFNAALDDIYEQLQGLNIPPAKKGR